jgi:hypothetical protein
LISAHYKKALSQPADFGVADDVEAKWEKEKQPRDRGQATK